MHVLYLYDYYRGYMAWVCACTTGAGASCVVIHTNFVPALMYQQWYRTSVWDIAKKNKGTMGCRKYSNCTDWTINKAKDLKQQVEYQLTT